MIAATRKLLETTPPAGLTIAMIAREVGADPALVRYYFGDRQSLLLAVVEDMIGAPRPPPPPSDADPADKLARRIESSANFTRKAHSMQRLMVDELAKAKSPQIRERVRELNAHAVNSYREILDQEHPHPLKPADALFVFTAVIGMCDFFASAQPVIRPQLPPDTDPDELAERYKAFVIDLVLNGLRPR
ncbi:MAG: TetR/AcrR family transcriptional regulator [Caulobacteraceae bacterium]